MADRNQTELTRTLRACGFCSIKLPDMYVARGGKAVFPTKGRPDSFFVNGMSGGFVEAKVGQGKHRQRFPFSSWEEDKREFWKRECISTNTPYWIFLTLGKRIGGKKYPRLTALLTAEEFLSLEAQTLPDRKSISHDMLLENPEWLLEWQGDSCWSIPDTHAFYVRHIKEVPYYHED